MANKSNKSNKLGDIIRITKGRILRPGKNRMSKSPATFAALFAALGISACALQPPNPHEEEALATEKEVSPSAPFVDYWQTRDPSEYRQNRTVEHAPVPSSQEDRTQEKERNSKTVATGAKESAKPIAQSQDVIIQQKKEQPVAQSQDDIIQKKQRNTESAKQGTESRVAVTMPVQRGKAVVTMTHSAPAQSEVKTATTKKVAQAVSGKAKANTQISSRERKNRSKLAAINKKNLWGQVRGGLRLADVEHERVTEQIEMFKRNPGYLQVCSQRATPFLHYLVEQIQRRSLPMDLVLVPIVESAFEPTAVSPKEAGGLWQIIPTTGQERGLLIADGYDGRFDIHTSTDAALGYLRDLNKMFDGDWLLTLAAYNAGPGTVQKAIQANKAAQAKAAAVAAAAASTTQSPVSSEAPTAAASSDQPKAETQAATAESPDTAPTTAQARSLYWDLQLPKETQDYVPKILALAHIIANPDAYGAQLRPIDNQAYLLRVETGPDIKIFDSIASAVIPTAEFLRFNPGFKEGVEPPMRAYTLLLPREMAENLVANAPGSRILAPSKYTVKKGETLDQIAKQHGIPSQKLAQWNRLRPGGVLKAGQQLLVYPAS